LSRIRQIKIHDYESYPPIDTSEANLAYISALKPGEKVIECGSGCMQGITGTVYLSKTNGDVCVLWDTKPKMGTSVTWGTRRIADVENTNS